jgi:hypothetical protein
MASESSVKRARGTLLTVLIAVTCLRVWLGPVEWTPRAYAQLPDTAKQRNEQLAEIQRTNQLLSELIRFLKTEQIKVVVEGSDKNPAGSSAGNTKRTTRSPGRR